jgi:hypothetical protein
MSYPHEVARDVLRLGWLVFAFYATRELFAFLAWVAAR